MTGSGVIEGGWEFVIAAYVVSAVILLSYALSVVARYRAELARRDRGPRDSQKAGPP